MTSLAVYRVQDADGRGPWRPGFSKTWIDDAGPPLPPTMMDEFGWDLISREGRAGEFFGSAVRQLSQLVRWFTPVEMIRLSNAGFFPVRLRVLRVLAESDSQIVVARRTPFNRGVTKLSWAEVHA